MRSGASSCASTGPAASHGGGKAAAPSGTARRLDILARVAIRAVLAEDSLIVREGLRELLASSPNIEVVATCSDLDSLRAAVEREAPEVVVTDVRMPPTNTDEGVRIAAELRATRPKTGVVVISQYSEPAYVLNLLESGSDRRGYLLKERVQERGQLVSAIDTVARGGSFVDPKIVEVLVAAKARAERSPLAELTTREREVLAEVAEGKSNAAIAESLALTKRAVEKHINSIFMKLDLAAADDVSKRVKATLLFLAERS
jgi:DNA-binding NarL/FixJ family response regulator